MIKYPKSKICKKSVRKRILKVMYHGKNQDSKNIIKRNKLNRKKDNNNLIKYIITNLYNNLVIKNNFLIYNLQNVIYKDEFVELITITIDGNCLFTNLLFYLYNNENSHKNLRDTAYQYISNNITKFYEFC